MKPKLLLPVLMLFFLASCSSSDPVVDGTVKIAVVSDIHYMAPSLFVNGGENGAAFLNYLNADPKLVQYSDAITKKLISELIAEKPDVVLIPGDLTKDGEHVSHVAMAAFLQELRASKSGMKIIVVPGNHDILNPEAMSYDGDNAVPAPSISADEFTSLYNDFGYGSAVSLDPNSLSYLSKPFPNLWVLAIDDCKYNDNSTAGIAVIGGNIKPESLLWMKDRLAEAKQNGARIVGMMHHNLIEHYAGQDQFDPNYVTDNWEANTNALMDAGLEVIFTGHYHANDISSREYNGNTLYDIQTASLVDPPLPYRIITLNKKEMEISTKRITSINAALPGGTDIVTYGNDFLSAHLDGIFSYILTLEPFLMSETDAAAAAPQFRNAYLAHFSGDEHIGPAEQSLDDAIAAMSPLAGMALATLWTDLNPPDNSSHITLK